jgi:phenylacetate-CoA ligase
MITMPSCVVDLCKEINEKNIDGINLRLVFTGGELLDEYARNIMRETLGAELFDGYGTNEVGRISSECVEQIGYHVSSDSIILEITKDGEIMSPGEEGEITITNLDNLAMPFIRYNLEDFGILMDDECSCGCYFPLMKITRGRKSNVIQLPDGRAISAIRVYFDLILIEGIRKFQVVQEKIDQIIVKIVKDNRFTDETYEKIKEIFKQRLDNIEIDVSIVDSIPRDKSGKLQPFITQIPAKY